MASTLVSVAVMGSKPVEIPVGKAKTVSDALKEAASVLGVDIDTAKVSKIKNGKQVKDDEPVTAGDTVTAAPQVANGRQVTSDEEQSTNY